MQLRAVALHQAAGHHQAHLRPALLQAGQIQDGVHRLLTGRLDEAAGIDQQEIGGGRLPGDLPARPGEAPQHDFRVHQVLGAAQGDGKDGFRFCSGFSGSGFWVYQGFYVRRVWLYCPANCRVRPTHHRCDSRIHLIGGHAYARP